MKWKYLAAVFICIFTIGSLSGCLAEKLPGEEKGPEAAKETVTEETSTESEQESAKIKIGVTFDTMALEHRETERAVLEETVQKLGAVADIRSAEGDVETQREQIRQFTEESVNVIIVTAVDCSTLATEIKNARNQGILVISYERLIQGEQTDLYVGTDSQMAGGQIADEIKEQLPEGGRIMVICGPENDQGSRSMADTLEEELAGDTWEIIYRGNASSWSAEDERKAVEEAFQNVGNEAEAVVCATDAMAGVAAEILESIQRTGEVKIIGQNGDSDACRRIQEGAQTMTIYRPVEDLAEKAARYAVEMAEGKNLSGTIVEESETAGEEQELMVPCYKAETTAVTEKNVSKWGRSTF